MRRRKRQAGFSLIETLYAVFICGVCAAVLASSMPTAKASQEKADMANKATSIAQKQLEMIRSAGYPNLSGPQLFALGLLDSPSSQDGKFYFCDVARSDNEGSDGGDEERKFLQDMEAWVSIDQEDIDLRSVTVTIQWRDRDQTRTIELGSLVANL